MIMKENKPMLIGLCGRSGSGKGYVSRLFARHGIPAIDTDAVYRDLTAPADKLSPCMTEIVSRFGAEAALSDNSLNRVYLRSIVFSGDSEALADLNGITHKYILEETMNRVRDYFENGDSIIIIDAPLLFESNFSSICDFIVCVVAPEDISLRRIVERDGISREAALKRLNTQISNEELAERSDAVILNDDTDRVKNEVEALAKRIREINSSKL